MKNDDLEKAKKLKNSALIRMIVVIILVLIILKFL